MDRTGNLILATLLTASLSTLAQAAEIDVPNDTPFINVALAMAGPGGEVIVDQGIYFENVTFPFVNQTLRSDGKVTIDGSGGVGIHVPIAATGARIEDLNVRNASYGIYVQADNAQVEGCQVRLTSSYGIFLNDSDHSTVEHCKIKDTGSHGILLLACDNTLVEKCSVKRAGNMGLLVLGTLNSILDNKVSDSVDVGIQVGTDFTSATGILLEDNRVTRAAKDGIACSQLASNCTLQENVIQDANFDGIDINSLSNGHSLLKNKVYSSGDKGLEIAGDNCTVSQNKSWQSAAQGIYVEGASNNGLYTQNKVKYSLSHGLYVWGTGNTFTLNKLKFNGGFDRFSGVALAANSWVSNKYNTSNL